MKNRLQKLWYAKRTSTLDSVLGAVLVPVSWAYRAGLAVSRFGVETQGVGCPVVSVGNLTVGGSGKTPLVVELVRILEARGRRVAVISRGYGRKSQGSRIVSRPGGEPGSVLEGGDEPVLIARKCPGAAVVVGEDRVEAGRLALSEFSPEVIVCDDAFQHRRLVRDLDILAVHAHHGLGNGRLLPRGPLREPRQAMQRADLVVFTHAEGQNPKQLRQRHRVGEDIPVAALGLGPGGFVTGPALEPAGLDPGTPVVAACAIAGPQGFFETCTAAGLRLAATRTFPDHHRFSRKELADLAKLVRDCQAAALVVTEKDLVGLDRIEGGLPVYGLSLKGHWIEPASRDTMESMLAARIGM